MLFGAAEAEEESMRHEEEEAEEVRQVKPVPSPALAPPPSLPSSRSHHRPRPPQARVARGSIADDAPEPTAPQGYRAKARRGSPPTLKEKDRQEAEKAEKARRATLHASMSVGASGKSAASRSNSCASAISDDPQVVEALAAAASIQAAVRGRAIRPAILRDSPSLYASAATRVVADVPRRRAAAADVAAPSRARSVSREGP